MTKQMKKPHMDGLLALLLFGVFAACILSVLLTGADAYQRLAERDLRSYGRRTAAQYLATKVRQSDAAGAVSVGKLGGVSALLLSEEIDGETYVTRIYYHDGYIREIYSAADWTPAPEDGEKVMEAQGLRFRRGDLPGTILVELTDAEGETALQVLALRSGRGAAS